jgi:peptidoglycan/LPS O-acetylase OafA/YrhL
VPVAEAAVAPRRLAILDGLRLLAALMVVSFHYVTDSAPWSDEKPHGFGWLAYDAARYGFFGVELFFLISGFVICMSGMGRSLGQFFVAWCRSIRRTSSPAWRSS